MFSDPEVPTPGMRQLDAPVVRGLVSRRALGDATGENRATSQPHQSTGDQAQDVKMEEETSHTSKCSALTEKLCGVCGYASLNGIAPNPPRREGFFGTPARGGAGVRAGLKCGGWPACELARREKLAPSPEGEGWGEGPVDRRRGNDEKENEERDPGETLFSRTKRDLRCLGSAMTLS